MRRPRGGNAETFGELTALDEQAPKPIWANHMARTIVPAHPIGEAAPWLPASHLHRTGSAEPRSLASIGGSSPLCRGPAIPAGWALACRAGPLRLNAWPASAALRGLEPANWSRSRGLHPC
jgi:hypothetical protein